MSDCLFSSSLWCSVFSPWNTLVIFLFALFSHFSKLDNRITKFWHLWVCLEAGTDAVCLLLKPAGLDQWKQCSYQGIRSSKLRHDNTRAAEHPSVEGWVSANCTLVPCVQGKLFNYYISWWWALFLHLSIQMIFWICKISKSKPEKKWIFWENFHTNYSHLLNMLTVIRDRTKLHLVCRSPSHLHVQPQF